MIDTTFTDALASKSPTPGGGGASAYAGVLAAALASMVGHLTIGKADFFYVEEDLKDIVRKLNLCRSDLTDLIDEDARAFHELSMCWKMPRETDAQRKKREEAQERALVGACEVPLQIMRICAKVIELDDFLAHNSSRLVVSDVGASVAIAKGALKAASLSVYINTNLMKDRKRAQAYEAEAADLAKSFSYMADVTFDYVRYELMGK